MTEERDNHRPAYLDRVIEQLERVHTRNPSRPGDRLAAVLLPLLGEGEPAILGILRSPVGLHGGQFGLPGGLLEPGDASPWDCALREAFEEVGLEEPVEFLGTLGEFNTYVSRLRVEVHVGFVPRRQEWVPQEDEVAGILEVPIALLVNLFRHLPRVEDVWDLPIEAGFEFDPEPYLVSGIHPPRGVGHRLTTHDGVREMPFIWGLTARVLYEFLRRVWIPVTEGV
jgi:8-oxo-dGTP pyrophosphatase MutT (NUDIX family)